MARHTLRPARISLLTAAFVSLVAALAIWALVPLGAGATPGQDDLRSRIQERRNREGSLAADAATFGKLERKLSRDVATIESRLSEVQSELDGRLALLATTQASLQGQRRRHAGLIIRLRRSQVVLGRRLVEIYQSGEPDLASFVLGAANFADLLERSDFLRRVNRQDTRVIELVRSSRNEARRSAGRLQILVGRRRDAADAVRRQRDGLASMRAGLAAKRASFARARAARLAALRSSRSGRRRLERELNRLLDQQAQQSVSMVGPGGPWAIPWAIVQCESGGQNFPPNWAGASGYYQIIPSTWALFGGSGPAAYLVGKPEQDRVAARIWNGGAGARNWDCYNLLNGIPLGER